MLQGTLEATGLLQLMGVAPRPAQGGEGGPPPGKGLQSLRDTPGPGVCALGQSPGKARGAGVVAKTGPSTVHLCDPAQPPYQAGTQAWRRARVRRGDPAGLWVLNGWSLVTGEKVWGTSLSPDSIPWAPARVLARLPWVWGLGHPGARTGPPTATWPGVLQARSSGSPGPGAPWRPAPRARPSPTLRPRQDHCRGHGWCLCLLCLVLLPTGLLPVPWEPDSVPGPWHTVAQAPVEGPQGHVCLRWVSVSGLTTREAD